MFIEYKTYHDVTPVRYRHVLPGSVFSVKNTDNNLNIAMKIDDNKSVYLKNAYIVYFNEDDFVFPLSHKLIIGDD